MATEARSLPVRMGQVGRGLPVRLARSTSGIGRTFAELGNWLLFCGKVARGTIVDVIIGRRFGKLVFREMSDIIAGPGVIAAGAGMVFVFGVMSLSVGAEVGLQ